MKHVRKISMAKVAGVPGQDLGAILDEIFAFVLDLVEGKGKIVEVEPE